MTIDLFQVKCPKCDHSAHMHNGGKCNARWQSKERFNRFDVCKCELSKDGVLLAVIENTEHEFDMVLFPANEVTEDDQKVWQYFDRDGTCHKIILIPAEDYDSIIAIKERMRGEDL